MLTKTFLLPEIKLRGDGSGFMEGYASTWSNWDAVGERPVKGAFAASLPAFIKDGFVGVQHNWGVLPVATPLEAKEDDHGLFVAAEFHSTDDAQKARTVIRERLDRGKSVKLSIGYDVLDDEFVEEGRLLKKIDLLEWSYVLYPANTLAAVTNVKSLPPDGMTLSDHSQTVLAAIEELTERYAGLKALRTKEGRTFSAANMQKLTGIKESLAELLANLDALLSVATPEKSTPDLRALRALSADLRLRSAHVLGVL